MKPGTASIALVSCTGNDCSRTSTVRLAILPIRVSGAVVGTTGTPVNRSIAQFVNMSAQNIVADFLGNMSTTTTTSTNTNTNSNLGNIAVNGAKIGNIIATQLSDIPALNGNENIRAIK